MGEPIVDNNQENRVDGSQSSSACSDHNGSCNGLGDSKAPILLNISKPPDLDYLAQLLKDKKQLAAFSNIFGHVERLLDDEINRVRVALFQCKFTREPLLLPDPVGEVVMKQEKIFVPVKSHPDYNFVGRILGPRGMTAKQLESETGCKIMVRGKGSIRDKKKEELNKGKANWEHLQEELHVLIQSEDTPNRNEVKIKRAIEEVKKLLVPSPEGEDDLKKKQLMELAIINGTYRNGAVAGAQNCQPQASVAAQFAAAAAAAAAVNNANKQNVAFQNFDQRLLASNGFAFPITAGVFPNGVSSAANGVTNMRSPTLAGAPLIMQQQTQTPNQQQMNGSSGRVSAVPSGLLSATNGQTQNANQAAQLAAMAQAQVALQMQISAANSQMFTAQSQPSFGQLPPQTATNGANGSVTPNHQAAIDYQMLFNATQCDPNSLLQLQQQQMQQQQHQLQQQQLAAFMQQASSAAGNGISTATFASTDPTNAAAMAAAAAAAAAGYSSQAFNFGANSAGSILSQQRRFLGQAREHPYGKREGS